jgi:capsule polysaccharide export protein KpsE/RkpR
LPDSYSRSAVSLPDSRTLPPSQGVGELLSRLWKQFRETCAQIGSRVSFWTVMGATVCLATIYYFVFAESMYESTSVVSVQNKSSISSGASSILGGVLGAAAGGSQVEQLYQYIISPDMLKVLDNKFHLRKTYSSTDRNPFWRLWWSSSDDAFLRFYQNMIDIEPDTTNSLITLTVLDYDAKRAQQIAAEIVAQSQKFTNGQSALMQRQTMKFAEDELGHAVRAVQAARIPYEQQIAEIRLSAAQSALASAAGAANAQQIFIIPVATPNLPTNTTRPQRILDIAGLTLVMALVYAVGFLMWSNVRDHSNA